MSCSFAEFIVIPSLGGEGGDGEHWSDGSVGTGNGDGDGEGDD